MRTFMESGRIPSDGPNGPVVHRSTSAHTGKETAMPSDKKTPRSLNLLDLAKQNPVRLSPSTVSQPNAPQTPSASSVYVVSATVGPTPAPTPAEFERRAAETDRLVREIEAAVVELAREHGVTPARGFDLSGDANPFIKGMDEVTLERDKTGAWRLFVESTPPVFQMMANINKDPDKATPKKVPLLQASQTLKNAFLGRSEEFVRDYMALVNKHRDHVAAGHKAGTAALDALRRK
jgi:hypothetical protein